MRCNIYQISNPQKTPYISSWRVSYGAPVARIVEKIDRYNATAAYSVKVYVNARAYTVRSNNWQNCKYTRRIAQEITR